MSTLQGEYLTKLCKIYGYLKKIETQRPKKKKSEHFFPRLLSQNIVGVSKGRSPSPVLPVFSLFFMSGKPFQATQIVKF